MASPFKFFRKHQTELLVVIGLLTMVAFIILPSVLQQLEVIGRARTTSNVVETQKYGALSTYDVQRLKDRQRVLMGFFNRLYQAYQLKLTEMYQTRDQDKMTELYKTYMNSMKARQMLEQVGDSSDQTVVLMWLLENKAREMGISINDSYISSFISESTEGLEDKVVNQLVYGEETQQNNSAEDALFNALNGYLLREKLVEVLGASWNASTTGERLDSFCRMNQRASVEFFPVKVEDFVGEVNDPSDAEVKAFFEQYKDKDAEIASSEPGLRQPQKIALEYCFGSYAKFMDAAAITDEDVQKNYDENKENYVIEKDEKQENKLGEMPNIGLTDPNAKQYRPLDDTLKEEIRQSLARVAAMEKLRNAIGVIQKAMSDYSIAKDMYEMKAEKDKNAAQPDKLDLAALAKDNNLEFVSSGLMTYQAFSETPLAQLRLEDVAATVDAGSEFFGKTPLLQSKVFSNPDGELFVVWKSEDVAEHTPTFEEDGIKQQAIDQMKYREARKLAEAEAKKLVDKAIKEELPLKSCLGDAAFVPPQFTWMTFGPVINPNMQRRIYLSPIEGVQDGGFDFMSELFQMKSGEIKSIVNASESVYYVTRMIELTPTEQLYARFCVTPEYEYAQARTPDGQYFYSDLREKLEKEAGLKWVVRPNQEDAERD